MICAISFHILCACGCHAYPVVSSDSLCSQWLSLVPSSSNLRFLHFLWFLTQVIPTCTFPPFLRLAGYLWFLVTNLIPPVIRLLVVHWVPHSSSSSKGCLWFLVGCFVFQIPQVPQVTCCSLYLLWFLQFVRLLCVILLSPKFLKFQRLPLVLGGFL